MKTMKAVCTATVLALCISAPAFAGDISTPGVASCGDISTPGAFTPVPPTSTAQLTSDNNYELHLLANTWLTLMSIL